MYSIHLNLRNTACSFEGEILGKRTMCQYTTINYLWVVYPKCRYNFSTNLGSQSIWYPPNNMLHGFIANRNDLQYSIFVEPRNRKWSIELLSSIARGMGCLTWGYLLWENPFAWLSTKTKTLVPTQFPYKSHSLVKVQEIIISANKF